MSATAISYNPFSTAISSAIAELTSDDAKLYYSLRAQQDIQTVLVGFIQLCVMAYELGQAAREWVDAYNASAIPTVEEATLIEPMPLLMGIPVLLALPEVAMPHPDRLTRVLVTPAPKYPRLKSVSTNNRAPRQKKSSPGLAKGKKPTTVRGVSID
jgi:hypothetical protein